MHSAQSCGGRRPDIELPEKDRAALPTVELGVVERLQLGAGAVVGERARWEDGYGGVREGRE